MLSTNKSGVQFEVSASLRFAGEMLIVLCIILGWLSAVIVFLHKWRHLRMLPPRDQTFQQQKPKNLENIRIVEHPDDTVIYGNYSKPVTAAMNARLDRLSKMPRQPSYRLANLPRHVPVATVHRTLRPTIPEVEVHLVPDPVICDARESSPLARSVEILWNPDRRRSSKRCSTRGNKV